MSTYPPIVAGMALTSALLQSMLPQVVRKGGDQSVTSSTILVSDTALVVPVAANATYRFELDLFYLGGTANASDMKTGWTVPSGASLVAGMIGVDPSPLGVYIVTDTQSTTAVTATNGASTLLYAKVTGTLVTGASSGNLQLTWAQNTSSATATTVKAGSSILARRIG